MIFRAFETKRQNAVEKVNIYPENYIENFYGRCYYIRAESRLKRIKDGKNGRKTYFRIVLKQIHIFMSCTGGGVCYAFIIRL